MVFRRKSSVADPRGAPPMGVQILSISCSFLGKFGKLVCWRPRRVGAPPGEILDPPLEFSEGTHDVGVSKSGVKIVCFTVKCNGGVELNVTQFILKHEVVQRDGVKCSRFYLKEIVMLEIFSIPVKPLMPKTIAGSKWESIEARTRSKFFHCYAVFGQIFAI